MNEFHSDALFSINTIENESIELYILFEHKSHPSEKIYIQLLSYLSRIYRKQKQLRLILPFVFYHGKKNWQLRENFAATFNLSEINTRIFTKYIPSFSLELYDLSKRDISQIETTVVMQSIFFTLKNIWFLDSEEKLRELMQILKSLFFDNNQEDFIEKLLIYLYLNTTVEPKKLEKVISDEVSPDKRYIAMSTAEILEQRGIERGKLEDAQNLLKLSLKLLVSPNSSFKKLVFFNLLGNSTCHG